MFRVYLLTATGTEIIYYEGDNHQLALDAVNDFNSLSFDARIEAI